MRPVFASIFLIALLATPFPTLAAINPTVGVGDDSSKDACKTGSAQLSGKEAVSGGGSDTDNTIQISKSGQVFVTCSKVPAGEKAEVTFCGLDSGCLTFDKDSKEGGNLMRLYDSAFQSGTPGDNLGRYKDFLRTNDAQTVLQNMLPSEQMNVLNESIIGKSNNDRQYLDYSFMLDQIGFSSVVPASPYNHDTLNETASDLIHSYALTSKPYVPSPFELVEKNVGQPYRLDVLTPSENMLYYGPQYVPTFEPARSPQEDQSRLSAPATFSSLIDSKAQALYPLVDMRSLTGQSSVWSNVSGAYTYLKNNLARFWPW